MDIEKLCPGCMRELEIESTKAGKCPYCGYDAAVYRQNSRCLPVNTILAGKYLVGAVLGEGGFGITYMGYDLNMETRIAIKEYFPVELVSRDTTSMTGDKVISLSGDKSVTYRQGLKKYVTEAQNVSQFSETPGVVSVKDFFYENEIAYIVMEHIEGISLKDYLKERGGRLSEEETLAIMKPVLEALVKVHEAGIIHRDISPDNIMLTFVDGRCGSVALNYRNTESDRLVAVGSNAALNADESGDNEDNQRIASVKLIDFGAARMTAKNDQKSLTIILKHGYAPEEQYRTHGEQGPWTDVYAVCAVLYRMLTGQIPVPAMDRLFRDDLKSFDDLSANVTKPTQAAILKGLAVKKDDRIQTIQELLQALYEGKTVKQNSHFRRKPILIAGICAGCLLPAAIAVGILFLVPHTQEQESVSEETLAELSAYTDNGQREEQPIESTDTDALSSDVAVTMEFETEELGETVAFPDAQTSLSVGTNHVLLLMPDGTVKARGANEYGQCMVGDWSNIVAVAAGDYHSLGLRSDGKVFAAGMNTNGECDVDTWENVVQIAAGGNYVSYGLTAEGKVLACGWNSGDHFSDVAEWEDIVAITSTHWGGVIGLDGEGTIHYAGSQEEVDEDGSMRQFRFEEEYFPISGWTEVKYLLMFFNDTLLGLKEDGSLISACVKESAVPRDMFFMEEWQGIEQLCVVDWPMIGIKKDGTIIFENNGSQDDIEAQKVLSGWNQVRAVGAIGDMDMVIGLQDDGTILEYHKESGNADIETMDNLDWVYVLETAYGDNLVALDKEGKILTYGGGEIYLTPLEALNKGLSGDVSADMLVDFVGEDAVLLKDGRLCFYRGCDIGGAWMGDAELYLGEHIVQVLDLHRYYQTHLYAFLLEDGHVEICPVGPDLNHKWLLEEMEVLRQRISGAESWEDVVQITGSTRNGLYGLHQDGTVSYVVAGEAKKLEEHHGIVKMVGRGNDVIGINEDGTVEVIASSEYAVMFGRTQASFWNDIRDISMGESHVAGLKEDGTVIAAGSNHEGQCDVEDWTDIVYLTTGRNCTIGLTSDGQLKMAGYLY